MLASVGSGPRSYGLSAATTGWTLKPVASATLANDTAINLVSFITRLLRRSGSHRVGTSTSQRRWLSPPMTADPHVSAQDVHITIDTDGADTGMSLSRGQSDLGHTVISGDAPGGGDEPARPGGAPRRAPSPPAQARPRPRARRRSTDWAQTRHDGGVLRHRPCAAPRSRRRAS